MNFEKPSFKESDSQNHEEEIKDGIWKPEIFKDHEDKLGVGACTKELKEMIGRPEGKIRITSDKERFDKKFSEEDRETKIKKLAAARILIKSLERIDPDSDVHDLEKSGLKHENRVIVVDEEYLERDKKERAREFADGMITNLKNKPLMVGAADCAPVGIYDPDKEAIGVFHSGWRGTLKQISPEGIKKMKESYGSDPEDLLVSVGPHADGDRFEVGGEVYDKFSQAEDKEGNSLYTPEQMSEIFKKNPENPGHYFLDSGKAIKFSLLKSGVLEENIQVSKYSTMSPEGNRFFSSERVEGNKERDSFAFFMVLKEEK